MSDNIGTVKPQEITEELKVSYLDYAMSVIVARALPDVRDGLKPVHRRILVTTKDLNLTAGAKHRKSAKIAGDVSGNYHPHGESNVYPAMVRLAQPFSLRYPLIDGQGNFGSIDGDAAAAMRYTEARMTAIAELMLADIEKDTVNFVDNYDNTRQEPTVLPAAVPQLLLNGTLGIAVGMASNIPPHNMDEVVAATRALIDNPNVELEELMSFVPGPDFPTGGQIFGRQGIVQAYATGRGKVDLRGVAEVVTKKNDRSDIVISEIPYQVNKADLVMKIADLVRSKKLEGISDIRDESDRDGLRIVVELKKTAYPKKVLNRLFDLTPLQSAFHVNMVALVDGIEPRTMGLKEVLQHFIDHRIVVVTRRSEHDLKRAEERAHILEGLLKALDKIDEVVATIRSAKTREEAHKKLVAKFAFSKNQTEAILDMRLATLVGLERDRLEKERQEKEALISYLKGILADRALLLGVIKDELKAVTDKYGDERRTVIVNRELAAFSAEDLIPNETVLVTMTESGYIKRVPVQDYRSQGRGGKGVIGQTLKEKDELLFTGVADTHDDILFFTDRGRLFKNKVFELPAASRQAKGSAIVNVIQIAPDERVTAIITVNKGQWQRTNCFLIMGSEKGMIKKTALSLYQNIRSVGLRAVSLREGDLLRWVHISSGNDLVVEVSAGGQAIKFKESDVRPMGRTAAGVRGMRLRRDDQVVSMFTADTDQEKEAELLVVTKRGFGKRSSLTNFPLQKRGGVGIKAANITKKTGPMVCAKLVSGGESEVVIVSTRGQVIKIPVAAVKRLGRVTQGVTLMRLNQDDYVGTVTLIKEEKNGQDG